MGESTCCHYLLEALCRALRCPIRERNIWVYFYSRGGWTKPATHSYL
uniref:Uncharacterized protein n=1 Tax=Arundo donax TaxID=35708 RepID=A0A0A9FS88_ARUDO